jgi:hypothetical protein
MALLAALSAPPATPARATQLPAERIPTADPLYLDLERLAARFGATPRFLSSRPLRRAEVTAFLDQLAAAHVEAPSDPAYVRVRRALDSGAPGGIAPLVGAMGESGEKAEISPYVSALYADDVRNRPDVNRDYRLGAALSISFDSTSVVVADLYAGTASQGGRGTPDFTTVNALIEDVDVNGWVNEGYVEAKLGPLRALAGHTWLRWGPGREGTLALSDAAPALDLLRAEVTGFRSFRLSWFVSLLDPGLQTYLAGHRLEWTASPRVTAGFTELVRFDGTSQAPLYLTPLVPYSFWEKRKKTSLPGSVPGDTSGQALGKNNVLWSADLAWALRPGCRVWAELMVDDISFSSDYKPDLIGYQAGGQIRRALGDGASGQALGASIEFSRVYNYTYSAFHGHHFAYQGFPLGFVLGPDVVSLGGELGYERGPAWEVRVRGEWRRKGEGQVGHPWLKSAGKVDAWAFEGVAAEETRLSTTIVYAPSRAIRLEGTVGLSRVTNDDHVQGLDRDTQPLALRAAVMW